METTQENVPKLGKDNSLEDNLGLNEKWSTASEERDQKDYDDLSHESAEEAKLEHTQSDEAQNEGDELEFPYHFAIETGNTQAFESLLRRREEERNRFEQNLENGKQMIQRDGGDVEAFLKSYGSFADPLNDTESEGLTPLHTAIQAKNLDFVDILIKNGVDINKDLNSISCLHLLLSVAAVKTHENTLFVLQALPQLLEAGVSYESKDDLNKTVFSTCAEYNLLSELDTLLAHIQHTLTQSEEKFNFSLLLECDIFNRSCIHIACLYGNVEIIEHLILAPFLEVEDIENLKETCLLKGDFEGNTCLHLAALTGSKPIFEFFLKNFAFSPKDLNLENSDGFSILQLMTFSNLTDILHRISKDLIIPEKYSETTIRSKTALISHEIFLDHLTIERNKTKSVEFKFDIPAENVNRIEVLVNKEYGILKSHKFEGKLANFESKPAEISDVLRVHEYSYVEKLQRFCEEIPEESIRSLDGDTALSTQSLKAAIYAAGSVCQAVDLLMGTESSKRSRTENSSGVDSVRSIENAFCCVRPPGHHAGSCGAVSDSPDSGSYGFCLLNNVAIGAAYARQRYRETIQKIAIVDFDVHHGNGTEACVRNTVPFTKTITLSNKNLRENILKHSSTMKYDVREDRAVTHKNTLVNLMEPSMSPLEITIKEEKYKPWLNQQDHEEAFFASVHGFGRRAPNMNVIPLEMEIPRLGKFYPASGKTYSNVHQESLDDDMALVQDKEPNIINVGQMTQSSDEWRHSWMYNILPALYEFNPDLILISAGFDAHKRDDINMGYVGVDETDFYWLTKELVKIGNSCCDGRVISVLEGGYNLSGGICSPFAKSVASHVEALSETKKFEIYKQPPQPAPSLEKQEEISKSSSVLSTKSES